MQIEKYVSEDIGNLCRFDFLRVENPLKISQEVEKFHVSKEG